MAPAASTATAEPARSLVLDLRLVGAALLTFALVAVALSFTSPAPDAS